VFNKNKRKRYLMEKEDIKFITGEIHFLELVEKKEGEISE